MFEARPLAEPEELGLPPSHGFIFNGTGGEFTRIWWTNLLLTICTLGIYSAWAKVRARKWFYGNTELDGSTFNYHADPKAILKGRLIVVAVYMVVVAVTEFLPELTWFVLVPVLLLMPWLLVRSLRFNARNSSYRGVRFDFKPDYTGAYILLLTFPLVVVTVGLAWPWWKAALMRFSANHRYGTAEFSPTLSVPSVYGVYLRAAGLLLAIGALTAALLVGTGLSAVVSGAFDVMQKAQAAQAAEAEREAAEAAAAEEAALEENNPEDNYDEQVAAAVAEAQAQAYEVGAEAEADAATGDEAAMTDTADMAEPSSGDGEVLDESMAADEAVATDDPLADATSAEGRYGGYDDAAGDEAAGSEGEEASGGAEASQADVDEMMTVLLVGFGLMFVFSQVAWLIISAYIDARLTNLLWSGLKLRRVSFTCDIGARDLFWLRLTNFLICVFTLFIAYPVTQVRSARYRLSRMTVDGHLDSFVAAQGSDRGALGEEAGDLLDIDIAL